MTDPDFEARGEAGAKAICDYQHGEWEEEREVIKQIWRDEVRAVLLATEPMLRENYRKAAAEETEAFIAAEIDRGPEPLRRLGEFLLHLLDDDRWKTAERMLLGAITRANNASDDAATEMLVCCGKSDEARSGTPDANECCGNFVDARKLLRETQERVAKLEDALALVGK